MSRFWVKVTPRAATDSVEVAADGTLHIRVRAVPADGAANEAVIRLLAERLNVARARVSIVSGGTARRKLVEVDDH